MKFFSRWFPPLFLIAAAAAVILYSGVYDMSATSPHWKATRGVIAVAVSRSVERHSRGVAVPENLDDTLRLRQGFAHFREMCVQCHGAPGVGRSEVGRGLYPKAPGLGHAAEEMRIRELFWIVKNGLKMSGMPAFGPTHDSEALWAITAFVAKLPSLDSAAYARLLLEWGAEAENGPEEGVPGLHLHDSP